MTRFHARTLLILLAALVPQDQARAATNEAGEYLPLSVGSKWVLRNPQFGSAVFEVLARDGDGFRVRSSHPWGSSEWTLVRENGRFVMTAYGTGGPMMPLSQRPLYLDFTRASGAKWTSSLGSFSVDTRTAVVEASGGETYRDCIRIRHKAGGADLVFTFARGVGYVQFGEGAGAFVLDRGASRLPGEPEAAASPGATRVAAEPAAASALPRHVLSREGAPVLFGLTPNRFANEPLTLDVMMRRFNQTVDAGVSFFVGNGKWAELEPATGRYDLSGVNQLISVAAPARLPLSYTLHVIDTIVRDVPKDLQQAPWSDPRMRTRVLRLIDALAPLLKGRARWFMFGYEIDGYFEKHPEEVDDFVALQRMATVRMKELVPDIQVSSTLTYASIGELTDRFSALDRQMDFLSLTYTPLKPDFTVEDPSVVPSNFSRMKRFAKDRKIVLQEIAYPTSAATHSNEDKQAEFFRLAFQELARDPAPFAAVNVMTLADLSDEVTDHFSAFYGLPTHAAFRGALQTLGMFDGKGRPKKSWDVFRAGIKR